MGKNFYPRIIAKCFLHPEQGVRHFRANTLAGRKKEIGHINTTIKVFFIHGLSELIHKGKRADLMSKGISFRADLNGPVVWQDNNFPILIPAKLIIEEKKK